MSAQRGAAAAQDPAGGVDTERVLQHGGVGLHEGQLLLHSELDSLKERNLRLHVPEAVAVQLREDVPGEVSRRPHSYGGLSITVLRGEGAPWPDLVQVPGVRAEALPLEDLFIEVSA